MRKNLLLLILLFLIGGGNLFAKKLDVDLSQLPASSENTTWLWDNEIGSGTFEWSATSYNSTELFGAGNYSSYTALKYTVAEGTANQFRIIVKYTNGASQTTYVMSCGTDCSVTFEEMGVSLANLAAVQTIRLSGANNQIGNVIVSNVSLEGPDINYINAMKVYEAPYGTTNVKNLTGTETNWANSVVYPKEFAVQGDFFGNNNGDSESTHVNIEGYDYICFQITEASDNSAGLRVWLWDDVNRQVVTLYAKPIADYATANWTEPSRITGVGTFVTKVTGYKYLKGVKAANDWGSPSSVVSVSYMCSGNAPTAYTETGEYTLVGEVAGSPDLTEALADANATIYDATGVIGSDIELTPANPNAIFIANAGTLSNTENVQVGNTIANLEIADGYPLADLTGATATAATYSRTMTNQFGTICLPYEVASTAEVKYYTIDELDGDVLKLKEQATLPAGTPAIVEKVSGEGITVAGSGALAAAGTPLDNLELIGTFERKTIMASEYPDKKLYVISNNQFVQGTNSITVPAFRAYFTSDTSSGANIRLGFADEEVTAINKLAGEGGVTVKGIYSASGASVPALQKGLNLVEFSDGSVRKVIVK